MLFGLLLIVGGVAAITCETGCDAAPVMGGLLCFAGGAQAIAAVLNISDDD